MLDLIIFFATVIGCYFIGKFIETRHYRDIEVREEEYLNLPAVTAKKLYPDESISDARMVTGNVVISGDYFKMIVAMLMKIFGGRVVGYESLIDRARREAILRMKKEAADIGADVVINMRFEMSKLDSMQSQQVSTGIFEILAYGTAIKLKDA